MTPITCFSLLFLLVTAFAQAQTSATVISTNGLKLREKPERTSKTLATAPFLAKVEVLTKRINNDPDRIRYEPSARRDTLGILFPSMNNRPATPHVGYWLKVRYAGKTGYMFSGFLATDDLLENDLQVKEAYKNFRLRTTEGNACASNDLVAEPGWNWYGLFRDVDSTFAIRKIEPGYAIADYTDEQGNFELIDRELVIRVEGAEQPLFMFGTRDTWPERRKISGFYQLDHLEQQFFRDGQPNVAFFTQWGLSVQFTPEPYSYKWSFLDKNGNQTPVESPKWRNGDLDFTPSYLEWCGDLDGDGKPDYILSNWDKTGFQALYLSSQARKSEVARLVTILVSWYCC